MKKIFLLCIAGILSVMTLQAQQSSGTKPSKEQEKLLRKEKRADRKELRKLEGKEINYLSKENFAVDFPKTTPTWNKSTYYDIASFTDKSGINKEAFYDEKGQLVGTTSTVQFSSIPEKGQKFIKKHYPDYTVQKIILFDDNEDNDTAMILYDQPFEDADNYFVTLVKGNKKIILQVDMEGYVYMFM